ncbi:ferritin-like domain-containing protein [Roseococcus sp.]|uniref:YciE/YciF ferroxidase family protein n=1 Tax=Roseococcus sp. TaxID=2109646 RepID=UPI003BAB61E9
MSDLFIDLLREMTFAERQFEKALPRMARAANSAPLRDALSHHGTAERSRQERLGEVFRLFGRRPRAETSSAILGLLQDCEEFLDAAIEPGPIQDAALIACGQAAAHHRISRYAALAAWAAALGKPEAAGLLRRSLDEEKALDERLAALADLLLAPAALAPG